MCHVVDEICIHCLRGHMTTQFVGKALYYMVFIDDYDKKSPLYYLRKRTEVTYNLDL